MSRRTCAGLAEHARLLLVCQTAPIQPPHTEPVAPTTIATVDHAALRARLASEPLAGHAFLARVCPAKSWLVERLCIDESDLRER